MPLRRCQKRLRLRHCRAGPAELPPGGTCELRLSAAMGPFALQHEDLNRRRLSEAVERISTCASEWLCSAINS